MRSTLKPLTELSEKQLGLVARPFYAVARLKDSRYGCNTLRGYTAALAAYTDHQNRHWDDQQHAFERLRRLVKEAVLVILEEQPLSTAYRHVDGQWQVNQNVWGVFARSNLEQQLQRIQQQKHEQTRLQAQRATASAFIIEDISEPARRLITLGPHEEKSYQPPAAYIGGPDEGIEPIFNPIDVVDAVLEGTAIAGIRNYLPSRRNVVKQMKPDVKPGPLVEQGGMAKRASKPSVEDSKLNNLIKDLYKGADTKNLIGTGSTADAIREEALTGKPVGGKFHTDKGQQYSNALNTWLRKNPNASATDRQAAQSILNDLMDALGGGK